MTGQTLRIFISSPGDVGEERVIAGRVVQRLKGEFDRFFTLEPILWEHEPLRATGHFQEQIIAPSKTDVLVCILWSRLGTRLPKDFAREDGTPYASGTEWEFEDAARSYRERGTPDLLVYRKTREAFAGLGDRQALLERLEQKDALDAFIDRWFGNPDDSFKAAFHAFETADEFEALLESHLRKLVMHAAFGPDGRHVVTASRDNTARLWDATSGTQIAVLRGHDGGVTQAVFRPQGGGIVTASEDKTARLWPYFATTQGLIDDARGVLPQKTLSADQRAKFFLDAD